MFRNLSSPLSNKDGKWQDGRRGSSELVALICDHLSKVKQALLSRSNMDKVLKEEAMHTVSEMGSMLNRLNGMFMGLESTLKNVIIATEDRARSYCNGSGVVLPPAASNVMVTGGS